MIQVNFHDSGKPTIVCWSLIDITHSGIVGKYRAGNPLGPTKWTKLRNQQRNFETLIQTISLSAQPMYKNLPVYQVLDLGGLKFGKAYKGEHAVWRFEFSVEHTDVFKKNGKDLWVLYENLNFVPCILKLDDTAPIEENVFITVDLTEKFITNVYFEILS